MVHDILRLLRRSQDSTRGLGNTDLKAYTYCVSGLNRAFDTDRYRVSHEDEQAYMSHREISELSPKPVLQLVATSGIPNCPSLPLSHPFSVVTGVVASRCNAGRCNWRLAGGNITTFMTAEWSDTHMHVAWPRHMETM